MRKKRPTPEEKIVTIINKMFEIAGHKVTYDDIKDRKDAWYADWTMTVAQDEEWKKWMQEYFIARLCKQLFIEFFSKNSGRWNKRQ